MSSPAERQWSQRSTTDHPQLPPTNRSISSRLSQWMSSQSSLVQGAVLGILVGGVMLSVVLTLYLTASSTGSTTGMSTVSVTRVSTTTTSSTPTTTTVSTTTTVTITITYARVGIYALSVPTCATWQPTGITVAGNENGTAGSDLGSLRVPVSIFVDNNDAVFVADRDNNRVMKYVLNSSVGTVVGGNLTAGNGPTQLRGLKGVAVDQLGAVFVADSDNYRIQKFPFGSSVGSTMFSNGSALVFGQMRDLHIDVNNNIYVTDSDNSQVVKFTPYSSVGVILVGGGRVGSASNQLLNPFGSFIDRNESLHVADTGNQRVMKYSSGSTNGSLLAGVTGSAGSSLTQLSSPTAVIADNNGYVYIADGGNGRIVKWTSDYAGGGVCVVGCTGSSGRANNQLSSPRDVKFDRHGNLYVSDQGNHRVQKFLIQLPSTPCVTPG